MHPDKALCLDRMNPAFYQKHWDIIGSDVVQTCLDVLRDGILPLNMYETNIVLIPKKKVPETVSDLRPINLCNVI